VFFFYICNALRLFVTISLISTKNRGVDMVDEASSKALISVVKKLKKFEMEFKRLVSQTREISESSGVIEEDNRKFENVKERLSGIQREISNLVGSFGVSSGSTDIADYVRGPPIIIQCKQWDDFMLRASGANTISFLYEEERRAFQVDALKNDKVYTYNGQLPSDIKLLKAWLSKELGIEENKVLEGILAIG